MQLIGWLSTILRMHSPVDLQLLNLKFKLYEYIPPTILEFEFFHEKMKQNSKTHLSDYKGRVNENLE